MKRAKAAKFPTAADVKRAERDLAQARAVISRAEVAKTKEFNEGLVGLFFKYRNCYSCPQTDADYWWMYTAVTGMDEHGMLSGWSFQTDSEGKVMIERNKRMLGDLFRQPSNYVPTKPAEFYGAFAELQASVALMARQQFRGNDEETGDRTSKS